MLALIALGVAIAAIVSVLVLTFIATQLDTATAAADPDKETPPAGWPIELKADSAAGLDRCDWCGDHIPHGETVWMDVGARRVLHVRCREREIDHHNRWARA